MRCRYYTREGDPLGPGHRCELAQHGRDEDHVIRVGAATHTRPAGQGRRPYATEPTEPIQLRVSASARGIYEGAPADTQRAARQAARSAFEGALSDGERKKE